MANESEGDIAIPRNSAPWGLIIVGIVVAIVLLAAMILGALLYTGVLSAPKGEVSTETEQVEEPERPEVSQAFYIPLDPAFVVNFEGRGPARFLQITVEVMARDPEVEEHVVKHMPVIRNNLVMLFSSQTFDEVSTLAGKEKLRESALVEVQKILEENTEDAVVEALYFTSFVMQ